MMLHTLLTSKDDLTAEMLIQVLVQFGAAVDRSNAADVAATRLAEERFDDREGASSLLEACRRLEGPDRKPPVTVALLPDASEIRSILGAGAHFILTKPVELEQAQNTFRAATAVLRRERRQSSRVAVQAPISIRVDDSDTVEGILLDLSTAGLDVLAAKPLPSATQVQVSFELPGGTSAIQGTAQAVWSTANGQTGFRFLDLDDKMRQELAEWLAARSGDALPDEPDTVSQCKLTDLSLGGCYVQTESPYPQSSVVDLCLRAPGMEIHTEGLVRVMHPGHGMGIEFPAGTEQQRQSVAEFINFLTGQPDAAPLLEASPRQLVARVAGESETDTETDGEDPLLELLRTGTVLEEEAFLAELQRQRTPAAVSQ